MWGNLKEKALSTLETTLDAAEDQFLKGGGAEEGYEDEASSSSYDPFSDARVVECVDRAKREAQEEVELQREAFEARIAELEGLAGAARAAAAERVRSGSGAAADVGDVVGVVASAALRGAGCEGVDATVAALAAGAASPLGGGGAATALSEATPFLWFVCNAVQCNVM